MRAEARLSRMLDALPQALQGGPRIAAVLATAAAELSGGERSLEQAASRLMRSRWPTLARGWPTPEMKLQDKRASELGRLAALFDLDPLAGEASGPFRARLRAHVHLHRRGLTTAPALLELAAAVYLPTDAPTISWEGDIARATLRVRDATGEDRTIRIEVIDNPTRRKMCDAELDQHTSETVVDNRGLDPATPSLTLVAKTTITAPELLHVESDLRLIYLGTLVAGDRLELEADRPPALNGRPARAPVIFADPATFDEPSSFFSYEAMDDGETVVRGARFSRCDRWSAGDPGFFSLPCGPSRLRWRVVPEPELRRLIAHWPDLDDIMNRAFSNPSTPLAPRLDLNLRWREAQASTFALHIPADVIPWHHRKEPALHWGALARVVERGRAAGVRGIIEIRQPPLCEEIRIDDRLRVRARVDLRERVDLTAMATVAGVPALTPGLFDTSAFDRAFAETKPDRPASADGDLKEGE